MADIYNYKGLDVFLNFYCARWGICSESIRPGIIISQKDFP
jgi:hypothetical protein